MIRKDLLVFRSGWVMKAEGRQDSYCDHDADKMGVGLFGNPTDNRSRV
jgi:hypothetical protein